MERKIATKGRELDLDGRSLLRNSYDKANRIFDGVFDNSLDFKIEMPYESAIQFIRRIESYNAFEAGNVIDALERVDSLIPRKFGRVLTP